MNSCRIYTKTIFPGNIYLVCYRIKKWNILDFKIHLSDLKFPLRLYHYLYNEQVFGIVSPIYSNNNNIRFNINTRNCHCIDFPRIPSHYFTKNVFNLILVETMFQHIILKYWINNLGQQSLSFGSKDKEQTAVLKNNRKLLK